MLPDAMLALFKERGRDPRNGSDNARTPSTSQGMHPRHQEEEVRPEARCGAYLLVRNGFHGFPRVILRAIPVARRDIVTASNAEPLISAMTRFRRGDNACQAATYLLTNTLTFPMLGSTISSITGNGPFLEKAFFPSSPVEFSFCSDRGETIDWFIFPPIKTHVLLPGLLLSRRLLVLRENNTLLSSPIDLEKPAFSHNPHTFPVEVGRVQHLPSPQ